MSNSLCVEKSKPSRVKRLPFLPRVGIFVDFGGREFSYRQAPLLETLYNLRGKRFNLKNLLGVAFQQLREINLSVAAEPLLLPVQKPIEFAGGTVGRERRSGAATTKKKSRR
jgi:hypothetical protein